MEIHPDTNPTIRDRMIEAVQSVRLLMWDMAGLDDEPVNLTNDQTAHMDSADFITGERLY